MTTRRARVTWPQFLELIETGAPSLLPIPGVPAAELFIDDQGRRIGLRVDVDEARVPEVNLEAAELHILDGPRLEVSSTSRPLFREMYDFLSEVADRAQLDSQPAAEAVLDALAAWGSLIAGKSALTLDQQVGLIAELWVLERIAVGVGWRVALDAWHPGAREEHDFALAGDDLEVKGTRTERRSHVIGSLSQLDPKPERVLHLVSVQLTAAGAGPGWSLSSRISDLRSAVGGAPLVRRFDERLAAAGWRPQMEPLTIQRFTLRSLVALIRVDESFPRLTASILDDRGELAARISDVRYRLDLSDLGVLDGSAGFSAVLPGSTP